MLSLIFDGIWYGTLYNRSIEYTWVSLNRILLSYHEKTRFCSHTQIDQPPSSASKDSCLWASGSSSTSTQMLKTATDSCCLWMFSRGCHGFVWVFMQIFPISCLDIDQLTIRIWLADWPFTHWESDHIIEARQTSSRVPSESLHAQLVRGLSWVPRNMQNCLEDPLSGDST